jgi:protein-S-isoprenylcysteine O-methyltransferase Ste14
MTLISACPVTHLVVTGLYRHVRNPMYAVVSSLIVGQGLLFGNVPVLKYGFVARRTSRNSR